MQTFCFRKRKEWIFWKFETECIAWVLRQMSELLLGSLPLLTMQLISFLLFSIRSNLFFMHFNTFAEIK